MQRLWLLVAFALAWAQEEARQRAQEVRKMLAAPRLEGRVIDQRTGEPLAGAQVRLGTRGTYTDKEGKFSLEYEQSRDTLLVSFPEYRLKRLVITGPGMGVIALEPFEAEVEAVEIVEQLNRETEAALAIERLRSLEFGESYTSEQIMRRTTDFYVPNVLRRLPGVSLLSGRWVTVRGMGERYNAMAFWAAYPTWLRYDGSMPVVNELVSTLLGRVEIRKIWTPELLGHFGGGMIDFQLPEGGESGLSVALTGEMGSWGLGQPYARVRGDWNRWENRNLPDPALIQASAPQDRPLAENFAYARQYRRLIVPDTAAFTPPSPLVTLSYNHSGRRFQVAMRVIYGQRYNQFALRYSDGTFDSTDGEWHFQEYLSSQVKPTWTLSQNAGISSTFTYRLSEQQQISLSLLGIDLKTQRHTLEKGTYYNDDLGTNVEEHYTTTLLERSQVGMGRVRYSYHASGWTFSAEGGTILQLYHVPYGGAMNYAIYPPDSAFRYETALWGSGEIYALSWHSRATSWQLYGHPCIERRWGNETRWLSLKIGAWYSHEKVANSARTLGLMPDTTRPSILTPDILAFENRQNVYNEAHRLPGGFWLLDRTGDYHRWQGTTLIGAGYAMVRLGYRSWEGMIGARYEAYERQLLHLPVREETYKPFLVERRGDLLPCLIGKYRLSERSHLKAGAYRTLIRPPVPAQVPLPYFDYLWAFYWSGDPSYRTGSVWNADLRWEKVWGPYRLWAVGVFYKTFQALPEVYLEPATYTEVFVFRTRNRPYGEVGGIELELREVLWGDVLTPHLWGYLNATVSESGTRFWKAFQDPYNKRLQGQAPYVVNAGLIGRPTSVWEISTFLNYTGPQIWALGFDPNVYPHLVERGRAFWEWQVSRRIGRWELRLSVWDVLNQPYRRVQRLGNANRPFDPQQDAQPAWQREEWRFYLTVRYRVF